MYEVALEIIYYLIGDFGHTTVGRSFAEHSWRFYAAPLDKNERSEFLPNVSVWPTPAVAGLESRRLLQSFYISQVIWENECNEVNRLYRVRRPESKC